jgi:hypothetical protein
MRKVNSQAYDTEKQKITRTRTKSQHEREVRYLKPAHSCGMQMYEDVTKSIRTESITKYTLTFGITHWEATQNVMAEKLTRLTHKIAIQLHLVAES